MKYIKIFLILCAGLCFLQQIPYLITDSILNEDFFNKIHYYIAFPFSQLSFMLPFSEFEPQFIFTICTSSLFWSLIFTAIIYKFGTNSIQSFLNEKIPVIRKNWIFRLFGINFIIFFILQLFSSMID